MDMAGQPGGMTASDIGFTPVLLRGVYFDAYWTPAKP
jgi:hypothetical protein